MNETEFEKQALLKLNEINSVKILKPIEQQFIYTDIVKNIELGLMKLSISKFCRTKFGELYYRDVSLKYGGISKLLALDIVPYFEDRLKYMDQQQGYCYPGGFLSFNYKGRSGKYASQCDLFNLYSLCNYFEYHTGIEKLNAKYPRSRLVNSGLKFSNFDFQNIIESKSAIIIYPQLYIGSIGGKREIYRTYYNRIDFTSYFDSLICAESRKEIIKKIDFLLSI